MAQSAPEDGVRSTPPGDVHLDGSSLSHSISSLSRGLSSLELPSPGSRSLNFSEQRQILDPELLMRAFKKVFPELTANINPLDYVDHLLAGEVINFQTMTSIRLKNDTKGLQDAARELLVHVCARDGGCEAMMDLFNHPHINQCQLYHKVLTEYNELSFEKNGSSLQYMTLGQSASEKFESFEPSGRYAEVTVEVAFNRTKSTGEQKSYRARLTTALTPGNPCWNQLDGYLRSKRCILLKSQLSHDPVIHIIIPALQVLVDVACNAEYEWTDLSSILQESAIGPQSDEASFCCRIRNVEVKSFLSETHRIETNCQLSREFGTLSADLVERSPTQTPSGDDCNSYSGTKSPPTIPRSQRRQGSIEQTEGHTPVLQSPSPANSSTEAVVLHQRNQDSTHGSQMLMPQSPPPVDGSNGTQSKVLPATESGLLTLLRRVTAEKLGVGKMSSSRSSELMNNITRQIVTSLQKDHSIVLRPEFTGSSFEGVKIESADEYDVMIILDGQELEKEEQYPGFVALRPRDANNVTFKQFLSADGYVDPNQIRSKLYSWIQRSINDRFLEDSQYAVQIRMAGPAVTLTIKPNDKKPGTTGDSTQLDTNFKIDVDLVATFEVLYEQFVAKPFKSSKKTSAVESPVSPRLWWRQSYSLAEKRRLKKIDDDHGCRRQCLRLLKFFRLRESTFKCLPSYCYKMLLLNECTQLQDAKYWTKDMLAERFLGLLRSMASCLEDKNLPNCFNPRINLLENLNEKAIGNIKDRTNRLTSKGVVEISKVFEKEAIN